MLPPTIKLIISIDKINNGNSKSSLNLSLSNLFFKSRAKSTDSIIIDVCMIMKNTSLNNNIPMKIEKSVKNLVKNQKYRTLFSTGLFKKLKQAPNKAAIKPVLKSMDQYKAAGINNLIF